MLKNILEQPKFQLEMLNIKKKHSGSVKMLTLKVYPLKDQILFFVVFRDIT